MNKNRLIKKLSIFGLFFATIFALFSSNFNLNASVELSKTPVAIAVTYYDDIDSRGFAWQTSTEVTESHLLYVKDEGQDVDWSKITPITGSYNDLNGYRCHKAQVTDLAGGDYLYKVGGNGVYSEVGKFTIDDNDDDKVSFTYVTDSQETSVEGFQEFNKTLEDAVTFNPDFIAFAGDLVDTSHANWGNDMSQIKMEEWVYAYDETKGVTMNYPMMSAVGNHESAGNSYLYHNNIDFAKATSTGGYYSFDYDNLHFVVLNTNIYESYKEDEVNEQVQWLEQDLASTTKTWKIVMMHIGAYSTGDHTNDASAKMIRDTLPQIFAKYKVDLVLQGHDHVYSRTMPYYYGEGEDGRTPNRNEKFVTENGYNWSMEPDGTYYITINYSGTKTYAPKKYDTSRIFPAKNPLTGKKMSLQVKERMYAHIEIDGDKLLLRSYTSNDEGGELFDYIAIKKNTQKLVSDAVDALAAEELTLEDAPKVKAAIDTYESLSERGLKYVPAETLEKLNGILAGYNLVDNYAAYEAIQAINKLNTTNYGDQYLKDYTLACEKYYNLTKAQKDLVNNEDILFAVKGKLSEIEQIITNNYLVQSVQNLVNAIETAENQEEARLIAKAAYDLLDDELKAQITKVELLQEPAKKKGCKGSILASTSSIFLLGSIIILSRRKRGDYNEEN